MWWEDCTLTPLTRLYGMLGLETEGSGENILPSTKFTGQNLNLFFDITSIYLLHLPILADICSETCIFPKN